MSYGRVVQGVLCVVLTAAFVAVGSAAAARPATAAKPSPLDTARPKPVCSQAAAATWNGPVAHCDAFGLAGGGRLLRLSAAAMPHRDGKVFSHAAVSPTVVQTVFPQDLSTAYQLPGTTAGSGSQVVGIVDAFDNPNVYNDLVGWDNFFRNEFGVDLPNIPTCASRSSSSCFMKVNQSGNASPLPAPNVGWSLEISLDVETVHALCHNCKIILVEASSNSLADLAAAENEAVALGATIITNSYGAPEGNDSNHVQQSDFDTYAPSYRHPGVIITASSGDDAFAGGTSFPADVNDVVAVGGTTLSTDANDSSWVDETAWFTPASGDTDASGAGSGCSIFDTAQTWQSGAVGWAATGCNTERAVADVSADADPSSGLWVWSTYWAGCPANANPATAACWAAGLGGTSLASPIIAATYALAANSATLQHTASIPYAFPGSLHDVTSGSTGTCGGTTICSAATGFDGPTGIGTPNGIDGFIGPAITSISPGSGKIGASVTIAGRRFTGATAVDFNGTAADSFTVDSDSQITATVASGTHAGTISVTAPSGIITSSTSFNIAPTVSSFSPTHAAEGTPVTITGSGFTGASAVSFGGTTQSFHVDSDTQITVAAVAAGTTTGKVVVTTPVGTDTSSGNLFITPAIDSVSPLTGAIHSTVTVTGTSFTGATSVKLHGTSVSFSVVSGTKITFTVPVGATSGTIQVTTPGGSVTSADPFTVLGAPTITSFTPGGPVGTPVTITGTNLQDVVGVQIGTVITVPTSVSGTQVVFSIPPGAVSGLIRLLARNGTVTSATPLTVG